MNGEWSTRHKHNSDLAPYYPRSDELSAQRGCVLWGSRVIVRAKLRERVPLELHEGQCRTTLLQTHHVSAVPPCYKHITSAPYHHPATNTSRQRRTTLLQTHHVSAVPPCYKHITSAPYHPATNTSHQRRTILLQTDLRERFVQNF